MVPGDRLVCAFVRPTGVGERFRQWPLHVTVVPWFRTERSTDLITEELRLAVSGVQQFTARGDRPDRFGAKQRPVRLIAEPTPFTELEKEVRHRLHRLGVKPVDESTQKRPPYRPHATNQAADKLAAEEEFTVTELYVVEQRGDYKTVAGSIALERHETTA